MNYYNDIDPYCGAWLENLIKEKLIPDGKVDTRSIADVQPGDLDGFTQCHFFAGIGGWARALELGGWEADRPVFSASCPCQPFSVAGKRKGTADDRHLWPEFYRLVRACRPGVVMGEQVSGAAGLEWLDGVVADMEKKGYTCRAADIPACAVNAPHRRNRLYWAAYSKRPRLEGSSRKIVQGGVGGFAGGGREHGRAAHSAGAGLEGRQSERLDTRQECETVERCRDECGGMGDPSLMYSNGSRNNQRSMGEGRGKISQFGDSSSINFWSEFALAGPDRDGKWRRVKPGVRLLAHGVPARVAKLRALGNAIVPPLAATFVAAVKEMIDAHEGK